MCYDHHTLPFFTWTTWLMSIFAAKAILVISIGHLLFI